MLRKFIVSSLLVLLAFSSCHKKQPSGILGESQMETVLQDFHLAKVMATQKDSSAFYREYYFQEILKKNHISQKDFDKSMLWYSQHADLLYKIYDRINLRLEKETKALGAVTSDTHLYSSLTNKGDTANIWNSRSYYLLSPVGLNNRMSFRINADTFFYPYDTYLLHFVSKFVYIEGQRDAQVGLSVTYDNDSVQSIVTRAYNDGEFSLQLLTEDRKIKHIDGFVYLNVRNSGKPKLMFVMNPSLIRFHRPKVMEREKGTSQQDSLMSDSVRSVNVDSSKRHLDLKISIHEKPIPVRKIL